MGWPEVTPQPANTLTYQVAGIIAGVIVNIAAFDVPIVIFMSLPT